MRPLARAWSRDRNGIPHRVGSGKECRGFVDENQGTLAEVHLRIGGRKLVLVAGELEEIHTGGLVFRQLDESVLAFTDPTAVGHVTWTQPRSALVRIHC